MHNKPENPLRQTSRTALAGFAPVAAFSLALNLLMLATPLYMMQIFDRVLTSNSLDTLYYLTAIVLAAILVMVQLDMARAQIMTRIGIWAGQALAGEALARSIAASLRMRDYTTQSLRDLATLRSFLSGGAPFTLCDAVWVPVYLTVLFALHPLLGGIALAGAGALLVLAVLNEWATQGPLQEAGSLSIASMRWVEMATRNAEVVDAMGMLEAVTVKWSAGNAAVLDCQRRAGDRAAAILSLTKFVRMGVQVAVLGAGAWLVLRHEMTGGAMVAGSLILGRAFAPVEQAIGTWKQVVGFRSARRRLKIFFDEPSPYLSGVDLPAPEGHLGVESLVFTPPGAERPTLRGLSFTLEPGEALAVVGPSAAGKSTLARLLVGAWRPSAGNVRLDGAEIRQWKRQDLGRHVGYLPQDVELFSGTVFDNIARLGRASSEEVVAAAQLAGCHEMILHLPKGYETEIGEGGIMLSAGQRQRIGLARAVFAAPRLVVLDEPNANLDGEGEIALARTLVRLKAQGAAVVVISHRQSLLMQVDRILVMRDGVIDLLGRRDEVMHRLAPATATVPKAAVAVPMR